MEINKNKADLNKDNKLSSYEKKRAVAIETAIASNQPLRSPNDKKFMGKTSYKENK